MPTATTTRAIEPGFPAGAAPAGGAPPVPPGAALPDAPRGSFPDPLPGPPDGARPDALPDVLPVPPAAARPEGPRGAFPDPRPEALPNPPTAALPGPLPGARPGPQDGPQDGRRNGSGPAPGLAVVIPHYNDAARLARCLAALGPQDRAGVEVVVVDNGSTEDLAPLAAAHPWARFVTESAKGAATARNRGVAETTAPVIAFLDADCRPAPDWIALARATGARTDGDLFGGRIDVFDETPPPRSGAEAFETVFAFDWRGYIEKKGFSVTANLVTRRAVFEATGPLIHGLSEDLEWCRRATAKGFRLRPAPDLRVGHPSRSDWPALERKWRRTTRETYELEGAGRGGPARLYWVAKALAMPMSALAHLPRIWRSPALSNRERLRGSATLVRLRLQRMAWMLRQAAGGGI